jgi:hypothetical protein
MNLNTHICDDWGWYIDIENANYNNYINFNIIESYDNNKSNKKLNYHLNRLETIDECEYEYYEYEYNENFKKTQNNEVKQLVEKGFFIENLTTIITNVFTYLKSLIFKLIR